jgi:hypothetical protein
MQSKSLLRTVCGRIADNDLADYFPSYEAALLSAPRWVSKLDRRHVTSRFVGRMVDRLLATYCPAPQTAFDPERRIKAFRAPAVEVSG